MNQLAHSKDAFYLAKEYIDSDASILGRMPGVPSGIFEIDRQIGGWQKGDLILLESMPAGGKTALATHFAVEAAKSGHYVLFFTLKMAAGKLFERIVAAEAGVGYSKIKSGNLTEQERYFVEQAARRLGCLRGRLKIIDEVKSDLQIEEVVKGIKASESLDLVFIDYLQLLEETDVNKDCMLQNVNGIKALSKKAEVPVVVLSQIAQSQSTGKIDGVADIILRIQDGRTSDVKKLTIRKSSRGSTAISSYGFNAESLLVQEIARLT